MTTGGLRGAGDCGAGLGLVADDQLADILIGDAVERADGAVEELPGVAQTTMSAGDVLVVETPGGGGYGAPPAAL